MCLAFLVVKGHPLYSLVVASNRDEFYERPTAPAAFWDGGDVLAGRDMERGGTWLGMTRGGRLALLTNYREPEQKQGAPSRGALTVDFLQGEQTPETYLRAVAETCAEHNGFNLIVGDAGSGELWYLSNMEPGSSPRRISAGIHGISNALLDTPWPKVERGKESVRSLVAARGGASAIDPGDLFELLRDPTRVEDTALLPVTGVPLEFEQLLSSVFVDCELKGKPYGTRTCTVIAVRKDGGVEYVERTLKTDTREWDEVSFSFSIGDRPAAA